MNIERSECGSGGCVTCPFSENEWAIQAQNYACLPGPYEIIKMKEKSGHNWGCHMDESVLCGGFVKHIRDYRKDLDYKTGAIVSYETWYHKGEYEAVQEANEKLNK